MLKEYVSVDLEMSGLDPREDRILEIGAVKIEDGQIIERLSLIVNPHRKISEDIKNLTGLDDDILSEGMEDYEAVAQFIDFAGNLPLVGHHIVSDIAFLKTCAKNHKLNLNNKVVDTLKIARKLLPAEEKKNLKALCEYAKIDVANSHRALDDAHATHMVLQWMMKQPESETEWFLPFVQEYKAKKQSPVTRSQIRQLNELMAYHKLELDIEIGSLTKNEASRKIDKILFTYGRIPKA